METANQVECLSMLLKILGHWINFATHCLAVRHLSQKKKILITARCHYFRCCCAIKALELDGDERCFARWHEKYVYPPRSYCLVPVNHPNQPQERNKIGIFQCFHCPSNTAHGTLCVLPPPPVVIILDPPFYFSKSGNLSQRFSNTARKPPEGGGGSREPFGDDKTTRQQDK